MGFNHISMNRDCENLKYFRDKFGNRFISDGRIEVYAMQGRDVVKVFYNLEDAIYFYEKFNGIKLDPIYIFDETLMN